LVPIVAERADFGVDAEFSHRDSFPSADAARQPSFGRGPPRRAEPETSTLPGVAEPLGTPGTPKSLPLILARELASNLATPMFLMDSGGMLVYYNDAAALLLGKDFSDLGEIPSGEFGEQLQLSTPDGERILRRNSPSGVAFYEQKPAHQTLMATTYDGERRLYEATAYPLLGATGEMHGVFAVFWPATDEPEG
jgi:PAS domain-containing protein